MADSQQQEQQTLTRQTTPIFTDQMTQQDIQQQREKTVQAFDAQSATLLHDQRTLLLFARKDSPEMAAVKQALDHVNQLLQVKIPSDGAALAQQCAVMERAYAALANHCSIYVQRRHPLTPHGKTRLRMVKQLLGQVKREQPLLASCAQEVFMRGPSSQQADWGTVLWQMRTAQLNTEGHETTAMGSGTSFVLRIQRGNERIYFKPEEKRIEQSPNVTLEVDIIEKTLMEHSRDTAMYNMFAKLQEMRESEGIAELIRLGDNLITLGFANSVEQLTQEQMQVLLDKNLLHAEFASLEKAIPLCRLAVIVQRRKTLEDYCDYAKIDQGATISNRNVATTRMAKLLGIEDMVAQSRTVVLTHEGKDMVGNVMREAKGRPFADLEREAREQNLELEYSPNALRQLMVLQLFDAICGQVDRNRSNYLFEHEDKAGRRVLTRLTAIDNDLAFGRLNFQNARSMRPGRMPLLSDPQNQDRLLVPGVDEAFYRQLAALNPQTLHYALADILSDSEINALCERLAGLRKMIEDNVANGTASLLLPGDWAGQMAAFANVQEANAISYVSPEVLSAQVARQAAATAAGASTTTGV